MCVPTYRDLFNCNCYIWGKPIWDKLTHLYIYSYIYIYVCIRYINILQASELAAFELMARICWRQIYEINPSGALFWWIELFEFDFIIILQLLIGNALIDIVNNCSFTYDLRINWWICVQWMYICILNCAAGQMKSLMWILQKTKDSHFHHWSLWLKWRR